MIVALTTASLDVTLGVAWWSIKQLVSGAVYLGTYLFSETSASKNNKILGDDPNFVPHAFEIVEIEVAHSHTTINKCNTDTLPDDEGFIHISKTESILTTKEKYFKIPLAEIIKRKNQLPLWFVPFLNTYPLANYAITSSNDCVFSAHAVATPIFSPFKLNSHLNLQNFSGNVYLSHDDVETIITNIQLHI